MTADRFRIDDSARPRRARLAAAAHTEAHGTRYAVQWALLYLAAIALAAPAASPASGRQASGVPEAAPGGVPASAAQWRGGPERTGAVTGGPVLRAAWPTNGPPLLWRTVLPASRSPGSVVSAHGRVYLTLAHRPAGAAPNAARGLVSSAVCLDAASGAEIWRKELGETASGGWAGPGGTPAVADGRVFVTFGPVTNIAAKPGHVQRTPTVSVCALDALTGATLWQAVQPITNNSITMHGSPYSSPLAAAGLCVVQASGVVAYEAASGRRLWQQPYVDGSHASPAAWRSPDGTWRVLCRSAVQPAPDSDIAWVAPSYAVRRAGRPGPAIYALELLTGQPCWAIAGNHGTSLWNAPTPVIAGDCLVDLDESGNAAFSLGDEVPRLVWSNSTRFGAVHYGPTPVVSGGFVYTPVCSDGVRLLCQRLSDGEPVGSVDVSRGRKAGTFASAVAAGGKVLYVDAGGDGAAGLLLMLNTGPDFRLLARCELAGLVEHASPTVADGRLLLRLVDGVACYDLTE